MPTEPKGFGKKLKGLFLEEGEEGAPAAASAAEEIAQIAQQAAPPSAPPPAPAGVEPAKVDFPSIYKAAGLSDEELGHIDRAEKLLRTLPANLPLETQKQILEGTLQTFGVDPTRIRNSIVRQQRALVAYAGVVRQDAEKRDAESRARIEQLRADALKLENAIEERARSRAAVELACRNQGAAVGRMLEFLPAAPAAGESK
jgi:hypothetical protein